MPSALVGARRTTRGTRGAATAVSTRHSRSPYSLRGAEPGCSPAQGAIEDPERHIQAVGYNRRSDQLGDYERGKRHREAWGRLPRRSRTIMSFGFVMVPLALVAAYFFWD